MHFTRQFKSHSSCVRSSCYLADDAWPLVLRGETGWEGRWAAWERRCSERAPRLPRATSLCPAHPPAWLRSPIAQFGTLICGPRRSCDLSPVRTSPNHDSGGLLVGSSRSPERHYGYANCLRARRQVAEVKVYIRSVSTYIDLGRSNPQGWQNRGRKTLTCG